MSAERNSKNVLIGLLHRPKTIDVPALVWLRRMNLDIKNSSADGSQRMLNAIEPGAVLPIHRHRKTSETVVALRGRLVWEFYDGRVCTEEIEVFAGGEVVALNVSAGQWHTVRALVSGSAILECMDGGMRRWGRGM